MSAVTTTDTTLRQRLRANPRPAAIWLVGLLVLIALEYSRFASGILTVGDLLWFGVESGVASVEWVEGNVAGFLGDIGGLVGLTIASLVLLYVFAAVIRPAVIRGDTLTERFGGRYEERTEYFIDLSAIVGVSGIVIVLLALTPLGGLAESALGVLIDALDTVSSYPSISSPEIISNEGHRTPGGGWDGTFFGLAPSMAWSLRVLVVFGYVAILLAWFWKGYNIFRDHYREADWTPRDDTVNRLRGHYWGLFGLFVVIGFVVIALWAPAVSPVAAEHNLYAPYEYTFDYYNGDEVIEVTHGTANLQSRSEGGDSTVGIWSYDEYDRWHPIGTNTDGKDLATFMAYGARTSLVVGLVAVGIGAGIAVLLSMLTAYYKGLVDLLTVVASDTIISMPQFLLVLLLSVVFQESDHPIAGVYDGGLLLALIFGFTAWPGLWRAVRGPALQVAEEEWVDAARSFGQSPMTTMRKHMSPYIAGYMMVYASLFLGGIIIGVAALSFLGLGINAPTPEWGRAVDEGRQYIATQSWHISMIPGIAVVLVVTGFNALGDGIRDAIDPESSTGESGQAAAAAGGGG